MQKDPMEDSDFMRSGKDNNEWHHDDLKPDKLDISDAVRVMEELNEKRSKEPVVVPFEKQSNAFRLSCCAHVCHGCPEHNMFHIIFRLPSASTLWSNDQNKIDRMK
jgi:hypothetical protein